MNTKQAYELLMKQVTGQLNDGEVLFTPQGAFNAIALFAATGKRRAGTQGQAVLACYLRPKGCDHATIMRAFGLAADDTRINLCHRLGPVNGKPGTQYLTDRILAETATSGKGATLHVKVTVTDLGKAVIEAAKPVKAEKATGKARKGREVPVANEPVTVEPDQAEPVLEAVE